MRINRDIRAPQVRVIGSDGKQRGLMTTQEALRIAEAEDLDLIEISPNATPPVCKIIDYGKYRYQQAKREKENKKAQHQIKVKEIKVKPNIDKHDLETKIKRAREFLEKGNKVKVTCMFRGREMMFAENGRKVVRFLCDQLEDIATPESFPKMMKRQLIVVIAPGVKKTLKQGSDSSDKGQKEEQ